MKKWQTLSSELVFDNKWFKVQKDVVKLPNEKVLDDYYIWKEPDVSQILAITSTGKILFVKQYKQGAQDLIIELPAGYVEAEETFEDAAKRELLEETGYKAETVEFIGNIKHNPTKSSGLVKVFMAKDVKKVANQRLDENEDIEVLELGFNEVREMIVKGDIWTSGSISSIFLALNKLKYKI